MTLSSRWALIVVCSDHQRMAEALGSTLSRHQAVGSASSGTRWAAAAEQHVGAVLDFATVQEGSYQVPLKQRVGAVLDMEEESNQVPVLKQRLRRVVGLCLKPQLALRPLGAQLTWRLSPLRL